MLFSKGNIAICLAGSALIIACYSAFFQSKPTSHIDHVTTNTRQANSITTPDITASQDDEQTLAQLKQSITSLKQQVEQLKLANTSQQVIDSDLKQSVLAILAEKEQQEQAKIQEANPLYGLYSNLPDDYELKLKSDPDYAQSLNKQLREQILDPYLTEQERLTAMAQLQMNMFMLGKQTIPEYDYEIINNMLSLATNSENDKLRVQAIELVSQSPILDTRLTQQYTQLLERDDNEYIRRLAAEGILSQYFKATREQADSSQQLAQQILTIYRNPINENVKNTIDEMIGNPHMLEELKKAAGE